MNKVDREPKAEETQVTDDLIAGTRESIAGINSIGHKKFLTEYLGLKSPEDIKRIKFVRTADLVGEYKKEHEFLADPRLEDIVVVVVPGDMWIKGKQPSESHAERNLILFNEEYFSGEDKVAWMVHELAHCLSYKDSPEDYQQRAENFAYENLGSKYPYPNNQVERYTFKRQFQYLKDEGVTKDGILDMLKTEYENPEDFKFFEKVLSEVF